MARGLLLGLLAARLWSLAIGRSHQCKPKANGLDANEYWLSGTTSKEALPSLYGIDVETVSTRLSNHDFTSVDLTQVTHLLHWTPTQLLTAMPLWTQAYIARILEVNDQLRPITEINPDALVIAFELDQERAAGQVRG